MAEDDNPYRTRSVPIADDFNPYRSVPKAGKEQELQQQQESAFKPGLGEDIQRAVAAGLVKGTAAIPGTPGDLANASVGAYEWGKNVAVPWAKGEEPTPYTHQPVPYLPTTEDLTKQAAKVWPGVNYQPQSNVARYLGAGAAMAPATFALGGRGVGAGLEALASGVGGEAGSDIADKLVGSPSSQMLGRVLGGTLGPITGRRAITPFPTSPERQQNIQTLENSGINTMSAGERTGSKRLKYIEEKGDLPDTEAQKEQFTRWAGGTFGAYHERLTGPVLEHEYHRIGNTLNALGARNAAVADAPFHNDMTQALTYYANHTNTHTRMPIVQNTVNDIIETGQRNNGVIPGADYNRLRSNISEELRSRSNDYYTQHALHDVQDALDDVMTRHSNPADVQAWQEARHQYRNYLVVEKALTGAGAETADGLVSPAQLRQAAISMQGRRAYAHDQGDFAPVLDAATATMEKLPNSGTAQRLESILGGSALGHIAEHFMMGHGSGEGAGLGASLGAFGPEMAGKLSANPVAQRYLGNQVIGRGPTFNEHLVRALLGRGGAP